MDGCNLIVRETFVMVSSKLCEIARGAWNFYFIYLLMGQRKGGLNRWELNTEYLGMLRENVEINI